MGTTPNAVVRRSPAHNTDAGVRKRARARRIALLAVLVSGSAFAFSKENPIPKMFPQELTFLATFDDGTAKPDVGTIPAKAVPACETADGGVIGKCLSYGRCSYGSDIDGVPLADTLSAGTVICWIRYVEDPPAGKFPGFSVFEIGMKSSDTARGRRLMLMQQADVNRLNAYYECRTDKLNAYTASVKNRYRDWPKGRWKMCVLTWTRDKIGVSHDGAPLYEVAIGNDFAASTHFTISAPAKGYSSTRFHQIDECAILNRKLTDAEIKAVYAAFREDEIYSGPIWVDNVRGDDANPGSRERPFRTITRGLTELKSGGELHLVNNGGNPYRECLGLGSRQSGTPEKPTVVDGHGALIDGFLPADDWKDEGDGVFSRAHRNNAWAMDACGHWNATFAMVRFAGRDGTSMKSREELTAPGQYFLKKGKLGTIRNNTLFVKVPAGSTPAKERVEMCTWDVNLTLYGCANVVVRNLRVAHQARDAFSTNYATNCLLDRVEGSYTMDQGISSHSSVGMRVTHSRFHHCAGGAIVDVVLPGSDRCDVTYEDCTVEDNCRRTPIEFYGSDTDRPAEAVYRLIRCKVRNNDLGYQKGVAVYAAKNAKLTTTDCEIEGEVRVLKK